MRKNPPASCDAASFARQKFTHRQYAEAGFHQPGMTMPSVQHIILFLFFAVIASALLFPPDRTVIDAQRVVLSLVFASAISGSLLLHRFLFPFRFLLLPDWKTTYIIAAGLFALVFVGLLTMPLSPQN
jgi:hypothetical protein